MTEEYCFGRNLTALSERNRELCRRLSGADLTLNRYQFMEARSGELIPARVDTAGTAHPLHSLVNPRREAKRLIDSVEAAGFLVLLGLGSGCYAEAALERKDIGMVLVIEYDINGLAELLRRLDYTKIIGDPRFRLLADINGEELQSRIVNLYQPVLHNGIRVIPLRARTVLDTESFTRAGSAIEAAIGQVSADYSVQAHFGTRWFSNIIRNLKPAAEPVEALPPPRRAAVSAAGPSLSSQIGRLKERRREFFLIATDTSLPCLLHEGINPDAVISLDCQHISYYHFMEKIPGETLLFLDLASPPLLASRAGKTRFFSGGHPLTRHISRSWKALPELDTSGGNVTYAALSLAEQLGASEIELYGADFSYPGGAAYARGTYIYSYFEKRQNRFSSLEAQASSFLFRTPLEKKFHPAKSSWYYETTTLKFYREKLEEKSGLIGARIIPVEGMGAPITVKQGRAQNQNPGFFSSGKALTGAEEFLAAYRNKIAALPAPGDNPADYLDSLKAEARSVFTTLLPAAAALKRRRPEAGFGKLLEETKNYCLNEIDSLLGPGK